MSGTGKFITLEGGEGVGKSTQISALAEALKQRGIDVLVTREPGGSEGAEAIRKLLLEGDVDRWTAETEALLFAAARSDHVARQIRPALDHGRWVLCDRFIDSTLAYQGAAGGLSNERLLDLHNFGSGGLLPDRTLLLDLAQFDAAWRESSRDEGRLDRFGRKSPKYHDELTRAFHKLANASPKRFRMVDASGSREQVTQRLLDAIADLLP